MGAIVVQALSATWSEGVLTQFRMFSDLESEEQKVLLALLLINF